MERFSHQTFSQFGEDVILWSWLETLNLLETDSYYVDIGAHHPVRGSNTYLLRKLYGWKGINVEPDPVLMKEFERSCPDCVNLQVGVGREAGRAELTIYNHPAANTISETLKSRQSQNSAISVVSTIDIEILTINQILDEHCKKFKGNFTLLTIDAEGVDYDIISSLDFDKYKPNLILIEDFDFDLTGNIKSDTLNLLIDKKYVPVSHCMVTTLYRYTG